MISIRALSLFGLLPLVSGSIDAESWTKIAIPEGYWQPLNSSDEKAYGHRMACAVGCQLIGQTCKAFVFDEVRSACSFGDVVPTWADNNYIPEYIRDHKEVSLRKSLLKRKAMTGVPHIGHLPQISSSGAYVKDFVPERPDLMPVDFPPLPTNYPFFGINTYKNTVVVCGGKLPNNEGDKTCR